MNDLRALCGASSAGLRTAVGPCVLRDGHDGPVHQDADGVRWAYPIAPDQTVVVRPGQTLLLRYAHPVTQEYVADIRTKLQAWLPDVRVVVISNCAQVAVYEPPDVRCAEPAAP